MCGTRPGAGPGGPGGKGSETTKAAIMTTTPQPNQQQNNSDMWGAIAAAAAAVIGGIISSNTAKRNTDKTNKANAALAEYQYSKDLEMWNKSNEFNSPQEQMKRLQAGNLNPNLVYSGGNVTGNSSSQLPKYQAPRMEYNYQSPIPEAARLLGEYQDYRIKQEQKDNLAAQRKAIETDIAQRELNLRFGRETFDDRKDTLGWKKWSSEADVQNARQKWEQTFETRNHNLMNWPTERALKAQQLEQRGETFPYQLQFMQGQNRNLGTANEKMLTEMGRIKTATEMEKLRMDWYETQMMSNLGAAGFRAAGGLHKMYTNWKASQKAAKGTFNAKARERAFNETTRRMQDFGK